MKIRNGYVSNSSSSSFILAFKENDEMEIFEKFANWNGYERFISDYKKMKNNKEIMKKHLSEELNRCCHYLVSYFLSNETDEFYYTRFCEETFIGHHLNHQFHIFDTIRKLVSEDKNDDKKFLSKSTWKKINSFQKKLLPKLVKKVKETYKSFTVLTYADNESAEEADMEHYFMPFVFANPISNDNEHYSEHCLIQISFH